MGHGLFQKSWSIIISYTAKAFKKNLFDMIGIPDVWSPTLDIFMDFCYGATLLCYLLDCFLTCFELDWQITAEVSYP